MTTGAQVKKKPFQHVCAGRAGVLPPKLLTQGGVVARCMSSAGDAQAAGAGDHRGGALFGCKSLWTDGSKVGGTVLEVQGLPVLKRPAGRRTSGASGSTTCVSLIRWVVLPSNCVVLESERPAGATPQGPRSKGVRPRLLPA